MIVKSKKQNYCYLIERLYARNLSGAMKLGLQNMEQILRHFSHPEQSFKSIHVAGSNGKGSTCWKIAEALRISGYKVGLYSSPHISSYRERFRINSKMISEALVARFLEEIFGFCKRANIQATFFEISTILAFLYFEHEEVDFAVVETGLGGRLDATNVLSPEISVITSISLEHCSVLGKTKSKIAKEKAGIIKPTRPVIVGPHARLPEIKEIALSKGSAYLAVEETSADFEEENQAIAALSLDYLSQKFKIDKHAIDKGIVSLPPCRMQMVESQQGHKVILDVAHNPDAFQCLFKRVQQRFPKHGCQVLLGISKNKAIESCFLEILKHCTKIHLTQAGNQRSASVNDLKSILESFTCHPLSATLDPESGLKAALESLCKEKEVLVVCGSFFIMGEVRRSLDIVEARDQMDLNEQVI